MRTREQELNYNYECMLHPKIKVMIFKNYDELGRRVVNYDLCDRDRGGSLR